MRRLLFWTVLAVIALSTATGALADGVTPIGSPSPAAGAVIDIVRYTAAGEFIVRHDILVDTSIAPDPDAAADQVVASQADTSVTCVDTSDPADAVAQYCLNSWAWPASAMPIRIRYNPEAPAGQTVVSAIGPIQNAVEQWSSVTPNFTYLFDGTTTARPTLCDDNSNIDGLNTVAWVAQIGDTPGILGQTCTARTPDGALAEFDMQISTQVPWSIDQPTPHRTYDLYSNLLHEFGHGAGIAHSQSPNAVMYFSLNTATEKRQLRPDDIAALQAKYGTPAQSGAYRVTIPGLIRD